MFDPMTKSPPPSLFARMGGRERLEFLLRHFYADVRQHREIGPIFQQRITNWPVHLARIADFWSGATGGPAVYRGAMPTKHMPLGLQERHFSAWLDLWQRHCRAHLAAAEGEELITLTQTIARRLRAIVGVAPSLGEGSFSA